MEIGKFGSRGVTMPMGPTLKNFEQLDALFAINRSL